MPKYRDYIENLLQQTRDKIDLYFDGNPGYPIDILLRTDKDNGTFSSTLSSGSAVKADLEREGDEFEPDELMENVWKRSYEVNPTNPDNSIVFKATREEWRRLRQESQNIQNQISSLPPNDPQIPQLQDQKQIKDDAIQNLEQIFPKLIRLSADIAQWAQHYIRSAAINLRIERNAGGPINQVTQDRFDEALESALSFVPKIDLQPGTPQSNPVRIPVRWALIKDLGDLYLTSRIQNENGYFPPTNTSTNSHVRTDLSREGLARVIYALWELYDATPNQNDKTRIQDAVLPVLEELRKNQYKAHYGPGSIVFFSKATQVRNDPRVAIPRIFLTLFPALDQIDALVGNDHMFVYTLLRIGGEMGLQAGPTGFDASKNYSDIADGYFTDHHESFHLTMTSLFFRFTGKTIRSILSGLLDMVADVAGGALLNIIILFLILVLLLMLLAPILGPLGGLVNLLAMAMLLAPAIIGIVAFGIHGGKRLDLLTFKQIYQSFSKEGDSLSLLLKMDSNRPGPKSVWETKMLQISTIERRKTDALFQANFSSTEAGKNALSIDLAQQQTLVLQLQNQMTQAARGLPGTMNQFMQASAAYVAARQTLEFAFKVQHNVWRETPDKIVRAHYFHSYGRSIEDHNAGGDIGAIRDRLASLNTKVYPLNFGHPPTNLSTTTVNSVDIPQKFDVVKRVSDFGDLGKMLFGQKPENEQLFKPATPEFWTNRTSVASVSPYEFREGNANIHWAAGEFHLCISKLKEEGYDIVDVIDGLNP